MISNQFDKGWGIKWPAPAKLNLMLRVTGRRVDGYHLLQTVFQMTDLCDWLIFYPDLSGLVSLKSEIPGVENQDNLIIRAANLLKQVTACPLGVTIDIEKNLPMGGGLGGGSSDAATTLVVLNKLWDLGLQKDNLMQLGLQLGADVPVFIFGHTAWGEGVGEDLSVITLPENWLVIVKPNCHVNTKQIFLADNLTRNSKHITMTDFLAGDSKNDCMEIVCLYYPEVKNALEALSVYAEAKLTGTGACVFAEFSNESAARTAFKGLKSKWDVFIARGYNQSPLYKQLEQG